jgi:hypothetical protein
MCDHSGQQSVILTNQVVAKVREKPAVNKQKSHRFHVERFNLKKWKEAESKEQYCVEASDKFELWKISTGSWELIVFWKPREGKNKNF